APVILALRMHEGVAVDLRRGGEQEARAFGAGDAQGVVGAERADLERLNRQGQGVERGGGGPRGEEPNKEGGGGGIICGGLVRGNRSKRGRGGVWGVWGGGGVSGQS